MIGAGAAGLVATRELRRAGHSVTAFEQSSEIGGLWVYSDDVETDDLLGQLMCLLTYLLTYAKNDGSCNNLKLQ